jgi:hypothetical protein
MCVFGVDDCRETMVFMAVLGWVMHARLSESMTYSLARHLSFFDFLVFLEDHT